MTESNVQPFPGLSLPLDHIEVQEEVVERLESLLEDAKSGRLVALAYVGVAQGGMIRASWCGKVSRSLVGYGISRLAHEFYAASCDDD